MMSKKILGAAYDIVLERGVERVRETVYIKNWQVVTTK